ncbi:tRNA3(Ser)-specific nuclease WapA precursor [Phycisphaerae bacterium RAS2]|nr:tRNA3(Ser)-specific nuclease WapA precursor [Phycisphaerae bacterium RAS2]
MRERTTFEYDGANRLTQRVQWVTTETSPDPTKDLVTIYDPNGVGNPTSVTLPNGHVLTYDYDGADRVTSITDSIGVLMAYDYDANGNVVSRTDGEANEWTIEFDELDRQWKVHDAVVETPTDKFTEHVYDESGNLIGTTNNEGIRTCYCYDDLNRLVCVIEDCQGDFGECGGQNQSSEKKELDGESLGGIQGQGVLIEGNEEDPEPQTAMLETSTPTADNHTCYEYDGRFLIAIVDGPTNADPASNRTVYDYNDAGDVTSIRYPEDDDPVSFSHYHSENYVIRYDQRNIETTYQFDRLGRLKTRTYVAGSTTRVEEFGFDRSGRLKNAKRFVPGTGLGTVEYEWAREYDKLGRPDSETQAFGSISGGTAFTTEFGYLIDDSLHTTEQTVCYPNASCGEQTGEYIRRFDQRGRLDAIMHGSGTLRQWNFDAADRRTSGVMQNLVEDSFDYDANGRLTEIEYTANFGWTAPYPHLTMNYGYDANGNRKYARKRWEVQPFAVTPTVELDRSELYGYDNRDRLTSMDRGLLNTAGTEIDPHNELPGLANVQQWTDLDTRGNWLEYRERTGDVRQPRIETREANGVNQYTEIDPDGPEAGSSVSPAHDLAGCLTFDPTGRFVEPPGTNEPPAGLEFVYDEENRVIAVHRDFDGQPGPYQNGQFGPLHDESDEGMHPLYVFKYDALGRRVETIQYVDEALGTRWDDGATPTPAPAPRRIRHVYAGLETIQEYACCTGTDACGETAPPCECGVTATGCGDGWPLAREFVWGDANRFPEPIVMVDFTGAGMPNTWDPEVPVPTPPIFYYYLHDALGSVVALTDNVGRLVERYTYDPYGRVVVEQPDDQDGPADANPCTTGCDPVEWVANVCGGGVLGANALTYSAYGNPFMWTGQRYDAVTGTYHFHYRTYSPGLGRWLQRDPISYQDGINLYAYVGSNPIGLIDQYGLLAAAPEASQSASQPTTQEPEEQRPRPIGPAGDPPGATICWVNNATYEVTCKNGDQEVTCKTIKSGERDPNKTGGPTPPNEYLICTSREHPEHKRTWYNLCPQKKDKSGYFQYTEKTETGRSTFGFHQGQISEGCVTVRSKSCFEKLKAVIDVGSLSFRGVKYRGTLIVLPDPSEVSTAQPPTSSGNKSGKRAGNKKGLKP